MSTQQPLTVDESTRACVRVLLDVVLRLWEGDPHQFSKRPCPTCRSITSVVDRDFGCVVYAKTGVSPTKW